MALLAWGANSYGQLGLGYKCEQILVPTPVPLPYNLLKSDIKYISAGAGHTIILTKNGSLYGCGWNTKQQLGLNDDTFTFKEITTLDKYKIIQISCGWDFSAAISDCGSFIVWGSNVFSQISLPKRTKQSGPTILENINAKYVSCGVRHMAVVTAENKVMISGSGTKGQLGLVDESGNLIRESQLLTIPQLDDIISVSCGQYHTLALQKHGNIFCWGNNKHGQLGLDPETYPVVLTPTKIHLNSIPEEIYAGWAHSVILTADGSVINFGRNSYGQLGENRTSFWQPAVVNNCVKIKSMSVASEHNLAITSDNKLLCWGWNEHGNCGTGNTEDVLRPTEIITKGEVVYIATGTGQSFAVVLNC